MSCTSTTWDGTTPARTIHDVWSFVSSRLRHIKQRLDNASATFYGTQDRLDYLRCVRENIEVIMEHHKTSKHGEICNRHDIEQLLEISQCSLEDPKYQKEGEGIVKTFLDRVQHVTSMFSDIRLVFQNDVLNNLQTYCCNYTKLGITDDHFYESLMARTTKIMEVMSNMEHISSSLKLGLHVTADYFTDEGFSHELALRYGCDKLPVLRIVPDLLQKLEAVTDTAQDWLRSDKVYMEHIQKEIEKTQIKIKRAESQSMKAKTEYNKLSSLIQRKQTELEDDEETTDSLWTDLSELEAKRTKLEMETSAVARNLRSCPDQLRNLSYRSISCSDMDDLDREDPDDDRSQTQSCYKSGVCLDTRAHSNKLDDLRHTMKLINRKILQTRALNEELANNEIEMQKLWKQLKAARKQKSKYSDKVIRLRSTMEFLETTQKQRLRPHSTSTVLRPMSRLCVVSKPMGLTNNGCARCSKTPNSSRRSAELNRAFRLVKNNIGYNWKDLVRTLPHGSDKGISEVNNDIRAIEYENQGQLREQAYQGLVSWYQSAGTQASVEVLAEALRDISEVRLAESVELETGYKTPVPSPTTDTTDIHH